MIDNHRRTGGAVGSIKNIMKAVYILDPETFPGKCYGKENLKNYFSY
jgi:hypothetical protein